MDEKRTEEDIRVLITGSEGFVGSHLKFLPFRITTLDKRGRPAYLHDIREPLPDIPADVIIHLAAETSVPESFRNPDLYWQVNVEGTRNVMDLAKRYGSFVVFFSSAAVYGNGNVPAREDQPLEPDNPYGRTKMEAEKIVGEKNLIFRPFNIFGKGTEGVIGRFFEAVMLGKPLKVVDGRQTRDFIYIKDVMRAVELGIRKKIRGIYNLGTGIETRIIDVAEWFASRYRAEIEIVDGDPGIIRSVADISRISRWLDIEHDIWSGLEEMADDYRSGSGLQ